MGSLLQDLRYGVRMLMKQPGFTLIAVITLALGIGANTAIFQLLDSVRLRSLPIDQPQELAEIRIRGGNGGMGLNPGSYGGITRPMWEAARREQKAFSGLAAWRQFNPRLGKDTERKRVKALEVSGEFFPVLRIVPWRGRLFQPDDESIACPANRAVVSYSFWQREMGGRELAPDSRIFTGDQSIEVVGVTPPNFTGIAVGETFDIAVPFCQPNTEPRRDLFAYSVIGRLRPGWTRERAATHLETLSAGVMEATEIQGYGSDTVARYRKFRLTAYPAHNGVSNLRKEYDSALWLLLGMTGLIMLIACANLANLMLARSSAREREIAIRLSLGASRTRLLRQFTSETALLTFIGAAFGIALAQIMIRALVASLSTNSGSIYLALDLNWRILLFASAIATITCIIFGTLPAVRVTRLQPESVMRAGGRGLTTGRDRFSMQRLMVVTQVAVSLVLLCSALLFVRSFQNLMTFDPGMRQKGISIAYVGMPGSMPKERLEGFHRELLAEVAAVPGVRSVGSTSNVPLLGSSWGHGIDIRGVHGGAMFTWVSPGYFETMGIPLISGRGFDQRDTASSKRVAVVNEAFVRRFCDQTNPLGQVLRTGVEPGYPSTLYEIVGVIPDTRYSGLRDNMPPSVFAPDLQFPQLGPWAALIIHTDTPHAVMVQALNARLSQKFPEAIIEFEDFRARIQDGLVRERLMAVLSGIFGGVAVILAAVGLYGMVSYLVVRRRNEIGIRAALGARRGQLVLMVMRQSTHMLLPGLSIGVALYLAVARAASTLLFGIEPYDLTTLAAATVLLAGIAAAASFLPARRAASVDPMVALRHD
jgi:predicted permease